MNVILADNWVRLFISFRFVLQNIYTRLIFFRMLIIVTINQTNNALVYHTVLMSQNENRFSIICMHVMPFNANLCIKIECKRNKIITSFFLVVLQRDLLYHTNFTNDQNGKAKEANKKKKKKKWNSPINLTFSSKLQKCNKTSNATIISSYALKVENWS